MITCCSQWTQRWSRIGPRQERMCWRHSWWWQKWESCSSITCRNTSVTPQMLQKLIRSWKPLATVCSVSSYPAANVGKLRSRSQSCQLRMSVSCSCWVMSKWSVRRRIRFMITLGATSRTGTCRRCRYLAIWGWIGQEMRVELTTCAVWVSTDWYQSVSTWRGLHPGVAEVGVCC